jgi:hypothetical protein
LKSEIESIAALLAAGASDPETLATEVIKRVEELRGERRQHFIVFELTPGVYQGYGGYATGDAARKAMPKFPMAQVARKAAVISVLGVDQAQRDLATADEPPAENSNFTLTREDGIAFKNGWRGAVRDRDRYLQPSS